MSADGQGQGRGSRRGGGAGKGGSGGGGGGGGGGGKGGPGGGGARGGGRGGRPGGGKGGPQGGRPGRPGGAGGRSGQQQDTPIEIAVRSSRNAIRRHAETVRDDQSQLACRSLMTALHGNTAEVTSPAELLASVEQVVHVLESGRREDTQLPVALRAVVAFSLDTPRRARDVAELLRLLLRHGYCLAADHIPRTLRDDGTFRASALQNLLEEVARDYLDDARFAELTK